tara:strand:+ start:1240 stop:1869 length:630 start_codon:yes stop_codon:yes gene_type:complete
MDFIKTFLCIGLIFVCVSYEAQAQTIYFPYKKTEDGKVIAPFGNPDAFKKSGDPLDDLYDPFGGSLENSSDIDTPHRAVAQLAKWSADIVVQALSFSNNTKDTLFEEIRSSFTASGWAAYQQFLADEGIARLVSANGVVSCYTLQLPEVLAQGVLEGAYKWVYDVPVSVTLNGRVETLNIVVQLTRVSRETDDEHDVKIETWKVQRLKK